MSEAPRRDGAPTPPPEGASAEEEYARTYAAGYEEGVRNALREVLGHVSRGHTTAELRMLVESRLARIKEEVDFKRRSMTAPPRQPAWGSLLRPPTAARPWITPVGPVPALAPVRLTAGRCLLVREERPARALEVLRANTAAFPRVAMVSLHPPVTPGLAPASRVEVSLSGAADGSGSGPPSPGEISGQLRAPTEAPGGALVYVDALEFLTTENSLDMTLRFVNWLVGQVRDTGSALLVSFDPRSLEVKDSSRLERAFQNVL